MGKDKDPLEEIVKYINATHSSGPYAQLFGTTNQALNTLQKMGMTGGGGGDKEEAGLGDNILNALQGAESILTDVAGGKSAPAKWYDIGKDGTVTGIASSMLDLPVRILNAANSSYKSSSKRAGDKVGQIKERNPTDMLSAMQYKTAERQAFYALKELIDPSPAVPSGKITLKNKKGKVVYYMEQFGNPVGIPSYNIYT